MKLYSSIYIISEYTKMQLEFDKDLIESRQLATEFKKLKDFIMFFEICINSCVYLNIICICFIYVLISLFVGEAVLSLY